MGCRRGLTFVELMITVAVIALLAGVSAPYLLASLPAYRVNGATRQIVGELRLARAMAVERGVDTYLAFDAGAGSYALAVEQDGTPGLSAGDPRIKTVNLSEAYSGIEFGTSDAAYSSNPVTFEDDVVRFTPLGTAPLHSGSVFLRPRQDAGVRRDRDRRVTVVNTTGRARAFRWTGGAWE